MKRVALLRRTPLARRTRLKPSMGTVWPPAVKAEIEARDQGCVGPRLGMPGDCIGPVDIDHVRKARGMGLKSRSTADNGVQLCRFGHHPVKTEDGPTWIPKELGYLARFGYPPHPDDAVPT